MVDWESRKTVPRCDLVRHCNVSQKATESGHNSLPEMLAETETGLVQHIIIYKAGKVHTLTSVVPKTREFAVDVESIWNWR